MSEQVNGTGRLTTGRYTEGIWSQIEAAYKAGRPLRGTLREMAARGLAVPTAPAVVRMAKRHGWMSVERQSDEVAESVGRAASVMQRERDPVVRSQVADRALQKLTVDELFRGHGESALLDMRTAMDRVVRAGESREIGPGEMAAALNRLAQALAFAREAMEGKRPATALQINHGQQQQPREVLIPASLVSREK